MYPFPFQVVDPRLSAGRGEEFSASRLREKAEELQDEEGFHLPMNQRVEDSLDSDGLQVASVHTAIAEDNKGFQMLQRMGWKGQGLGSKEDGIVEPVKGGAEPGLRLGVGKQEQDDFYTAADNVQRRRLEVEIQADEDESRTAKREIQAEREQRIKEDVTAIKRTFYCDVCHKQYASAAEMETHLSSYDHHHKKRLIEMRASEYERTRKDRDRKEKRRLEKEHARLNEQIQKAHGARAAPSGASAAPPPPPDEAPPPPPPADEPPPPPPPDTPSTDSPWQGGSAAVQMSRGAVQFNMGGPPKKGGGAAGFSLGVKQPPHLKKKVGKLKASVAAFAMDSDDES